MAPKKRPNMEPSAIVTRISSRSGKSKLNSDSDPQPPTIVTRRSSRKLYSDSGPQPPKSNKAKTNASGASSSSMASKKRKAIVTRSGKAKLDADSEPPKSNKAKTNTSDGGGGGGASSSKKEANKESAVIVTRSSTRQRGKAKVGSTSDSQPPKSKKAKTNISDDGGASSSMASKKKANVKPSAIATRSSNRILNSPLGVAGKPKFKKPPKKMANVESSSVVVTRSGKGKAKLESKLLSANTCDAVKKRANVEPSGRREKGKVKMENVETSTAVLTRRAKGKAKEDDTSLAPKSKGKGNAPSSTAPKGRADVQTSGVLTRRGKAKMDSDPTPPANPQPPKSNKPIRKTSTSSRVTRPKRN